MHTARRAFACIAIVGLVIAVVVIQQRRGDAPVVDPVDVAPPPIDEAGSFQQAARAAAPATDRTSSPPSITASTDEAVNTCAQILDDAAAFAQGEALWWKAAFALQALQWNDDRVRAELDDLQRRQAGTPDPELFLTMFLVDQESDAASDDPPDYAPLLDLGLRAASSDSPLVAWHALKACAEAEEYCPFPDLEQRLLEIDRDNAEAWALVATLAYQRGDVAGALDAMQGAASASTSTVYWSETIALIERSLAAQTTLPFPIRMVTAYGPTATTSLLSQSDMCGAESATNRAWAEACLALGTLRTETDGTILERGLGYSMRRKALTALGDLEGAAEVAREYALFSDHWTAGVYDPAMSRARSRLQGALITTPEQWQAFISAIQEFGEVEGIRQIFRQGLPPLLERAGLLDRDGARECAAQLFEAPTPVGTLSATFRNYPVGQYPIQAGDQLQISVRGASGLSQSHRVGPDGMIALRGVRGSARLGVPVIAALGKTTEQIEHEIATILSGRNPSTQSFEVYVTLFSPPSTEELLLNFDEAQRDTAESREEPR